jgi:hypothetical protein
LKITQDGSPAFGRTQSWVSCIKKALSESREGRLKLQAKRVTHDSAMSLGFLSISLFPLSEGGSPELQSGERAIQAREKTPQKSGL